MPVEPKEKIDLGFAIDVAALSRGIKAMGELQRLLSKMTMSAAGVEDVGTAFKKVHKEASAVQTTVSSLTGGMQKKFASAKTQIDPLVKSMAGFGGEINKTSGKTDKFAGFFKSAVGAAKKGGGVMSKSWRAVAGGISGAKNTMTQFQQKTTEALNGMKDQMSRMNDSVSGAIGGLKNLLVAGLALGGISVGIGSIKDAFMGAFNTGMELEKMTVKMTNKFGSPAFAEKATGFINDMSQEYGLSKDELGSYVDELAKAGVSMESMNFKGVLEAAMGPGQDLSTTMSAITDVAKNPGNFQAFAETFGNQIDPAAFQEAIDGATTYQERMTKISDFLGKNFEGNTDRFKDSAEGQIQNITGFIEKIKETIASSGVFDAMKEVLGNVSKWVDQNKPAILGAAKAIGGLMGTIVKFIGGMLGNIFKSANAGVGFFAGIQQKLKDIFFPLMFMLAYIGMKIGDIIGKLFKGDLSGAAVDIGDILMKIIDAVEGFVNMAVGFVFGLIQKIADQVPKLLPVIMAQVSRVMDRLVTFAQNLVKKIMGILPALLTLFIAEIRLKILLAKKVILGLLDVIGTVLDGIPGLITSIGPILVKGVNDIINDVFDFFMGLGERLTKLWPKLLASLTAIFNNLPKILKPILQNLFKKLFAILEDLVPRLFVILYDTVVWAFKSIGSLGPKLGEILSDVIGYLGEWVSGLMGRLEDMLMNSDNPFLKWLGGIVGTVRNVWDAVVGIVQDILTYAGKILGDIGDMFGALFSGDFGGAWEAIKNLFGHIWELIVSVLGRVVTFIWKELKTIWKTITGIFGSAWKWVSDKTASFINGIVDFFKSLPSRILGFIQSIPNEVMKLLQNGLKFLDGMFGKVIDGIFGEGVFDGLKDQLNEFVNFFIKKYNSLTSVIGKDPINIVVNDKPAKEVLRAMRDDLGLQLKDMSRSTDMSDYIKKLNETVVNSGIDGNSDQYKALETLTKQMYTLNKELGSAPAKDRKGINDKLIEVLTAFDTIRSENMFSNQQFGKDGSAGSGDANMVMSAVMEKFGKENYAQKKNKVFAERAAVTVPIKDGIVKDGQVTPIDPRDAVFATKEPKKAGMIQNVMNGISDVWGTVKEKASDLVGGGADIWKKFKQSNVGELVAGIFNGVPTDTGSISEVASKFMGDFTNMFQGTMIGSPGQGNVLRGTKDFSGKKADEKQLALLGYVDRATDIVNDQTKDLMNWCAAFVSNVYTDVFGKVSPKFYNDVVKGRLGTGGAALGESFAGAAPYFKKAKKPEEFGMFYYGVPGKGHVGLVRSVDSGSSFTSFEGNTSTPGRPDSRTGGTFVSKPRQVDWVLGQPHGAFVNPNWDAINKYGKVAKDFVMKQDGSVQLFEPTDTVFGMRNPDKMFSALLSGQTPSGQVTNTVEREQSAPVSNTTNFSFGPNSIVIQSSGNEKIDAEALLRELERIQRRKNGRAGLSEK